MNPPPTVVPNIACRGAAVPSGRYAAAFITFSAAPWKSPYWNTPVPNPMPPKAHGPITMPAASSPRIDGSFIQAATIPPSFAAKMMMPICSTRNIISSTRGRLKSGYAGIISVEPKTPAAAKIAATTKNNFLFFI